MRGGANVFWIAATLGACALGCAAFAEERPVSFSLKPGQEVTFAASVVDGRVALGPGKITKIGTADPKDGEITIGFAHAVRSFYAQALAREKTATPIDFVATSLVGGTKIDETVVCGLVDTPIAKRVANSAWRLSLKDFEPGKGDGSCD